MIKFTRTSPLAKAPVYASAGAAAADVHAINEKQVIINPGKSAFFATGLKFEIPQGTVLKAYSRSGHGFKNGIRLVNSVGVLDHDYRGELGVKLHNDSDTAYVVEPFERICQIMLEQAPQIPFVEVTQLSETVRGENGFGSTGRA